MAKLLAVTIVIIAILSAIPIITHKWPGDISVGLPQDISTHGAPIDEQISETMAEAGIAFLASQLILAFFIWKFSNPKPDDKGQELSRAAPRALVLAGVPAGGNGGFGAWEFLALRPGPASISRLLRQTRCRFKCKLDSSPFISVIPARTGSLARSTRTDQRSQPEFLWA